MPEDNPPQQPGKVPQLSLSEALMMEGDEKSQMDKIIEMILDPANIAHNTELTRNEITAFSVLATLFKQHPKAFPVLGEFLKVNLVYRVSKNRKGRGELIKILNQQVHNQEMQTNMDSQRRGWFGRRR